MDRHTLSEAIRLFLREDIGPGDLTSEAIFTAGQTGEARLVAKEDFLVAGASEIVPLVFSLHDLQIICTPQIPDGSRVRHGETILHASGPIRSLLEAERLALNLLQRLSGIATLTAAFVEAVAGLPVRIVDTRKTTPGLRALEKYAVRIGGGFNHRFNLADGVLIKDNHIAACGSIAAAVKAARNRVPHTHKIEVEATDLAQVEECLACGVEIIMLDNMDPDLMRRAVELIGGRALVEASGGVSLETVRAIAETGVDLISVGALTHSARAVDISMQMTTTSITPLAD